MSSCGVTYSCLHKYRESNREVLGVPIERDHIGIVAIGGTNPMAAVQEQGIPIRTQALSELIDIDEMEMV